MDKELQDKIHNSIVIDFTKPGFNRVERAKIIQEYMDEHNLSLRKMAGKLNISHTLLRRWTSFSDTVIPKKQETNNLTEDDIDEMIDEGKDNKTKVMKFKLSEALRSVKYVVKNLDEDTATNENKEKLEEILSIVDECLDKIRELEG